MRKTLWAVLAAILISTSAHADWLELSPHAGYSTVSMGELNQSNANLWAWSGIGRLDTIESGVVAGLDATTKHLTSIDWLDLGIRGEYLQTNEAVNDSRDPVNGNPSYNTNQGSLGSFLVGAKANAPFNDSLKLGVAAWVGYGYATMAQHVSINDGAPYSDGIFTGSGLVGQLEGSLSWKLASHLSLSFIGGWRWADFAELKDGNGTPLYDNLQLWERGVKNPVNVDFSGATAQGALNVTF